MYSFPFLLLVPFGWATNRYLFCMGNVVSITGDHNHTTFDAASNIVGTRRFTGNTNVEFTFVGSVDGSVNASTFPGHLASLDLVRGVEALINATIGHNMEMEVGLVSSVVDIRPRVDIITDIECPTNLGYAEAGTACLHFVIEVPLTISNGPDEYVVKDGVRSKLLEATNFDGSLFDAVKSVNGESEFIGIGRPGGQQAVESI